MATFDVFVEGPTDASPEAMQRLAAIMSQRYGLPAAELVTRMSKGRFRVKGNIDEGTANTYARDLEAIGARVTIIESRGSGASVPPVSANVVTRGASGPVPLASSAARSGGSSLPPATGPSTARSGGSSLPPATGPSTARSGGSSLPPANAARSTGTPPFASGLAAAFSDEGSAAGLGALDSLSLTSLDDEPEPKPAGSFEPPVNASLPASIGPAAKPGAKPARTERPKDVPLDLFAPPDAGDAFKVDLAIDEQEHRDRKRTATPPVPTAVVPVPHGSTTPGRGVAPTPPSTPVLQRRSTPSLPPRSEPLGVVAPEPPRWRFAAGVLLAIILGFIPAHIVATVRERSAFAAIDNEVSETQKASSAPNATVPYAKLDEFRDAREDRKKSERRSIALLSMVIWAAVAGGLAYVWFRRIPWDRGG